MDGCDAMLSGSLRRIRPTHLHRRLLKVVFISSSWHRPSSFGLKLVLSQNIREILRRHVVYNILRSASDIRQHSQPYITRLIGHTSLNSQLCFVVLLCWHPVVFYPIKVPLTFFSRFWIYVAVCSTVAFLSHLQGRWRIPYGWYLDHQSC